MYCELFTLIFLSKASYKSFLLAAILCFLSIPQTVFATGQVNVKDQFALQYG